MTEGKALALVYVGSVIAFLGGYAVLTALGAGNEAIVFMTLVFLVVGTQALETVVHRYSGKRQRHKR